MKKERLDVLLVKRNLAESREKAKRFVMAGLVFSRNERLDKPGMRLNYDTPLTVKGQMPYVGRGGYKLEKALKYFNISINDKIAVDVGASTGGFTDCALQNGAALVYAIDVGYNQLDWKLRSDDRVVVMERTNFRYVTKELFKKGYPNFAMIDVSFISLRLILPVLKQIIQDESDIVVLIKPQFEAGKDEVGKRGVVQDKKVHQSVLEKLILFSKEEGFTCIELTYSPITGSKGNIEYLAHFRLEQKMGKIKEDQINLLIKNVVNEAHEDLLK